MRRILFLAQAEVLHILRDRVLLAQVLIVPVVQLLILSNAATFQIRNTPIYIADFDRTSTSRGTRASASGPTPARCVRLLRSKARRSIHAGKTGARDPARSSDWRPECEAPDIR